MQSFAYSSKWMAMALSLDGLITLLSASVEQFTGYSPQELVGQPLTQALAESSAHEVPRMMDVAKEGGYWSGEIAHRTRDSGVLKAHGSFSLLAGPHDRVSGFLLISSLDKSIGRGRVESVALGEVGAKLRMFAHELNNPLAVTMGFAQLLTLNTNCQGKMRSDIQKLYSELERVIQVVEKLHTYAIALNKRFQPDQILEIQGKKS